MFVLVATKPLNDGTSGFRFNVLGQKGLVRKRKRKVRATGKQVGPTMDVFQSASFHLHLKRSVQPENLLTLQVNIMVQCANMVHCTP